MLFYVLWWLTSIVGLFYFSFRLRHFDFLSLGFFSALIYFLPLFFGYTLGTKLNSSAPVEQEVYLIGSTLIFILVISAECVERLTIYTTVPRGYSHNKINIVFFFFIALTGLVGMIEQTGQALLSGDKKELLNELGRFHIVYSISSILGLVSAYLSRQSFFIFLFSAFLLLDITLGFRASAATGFLGVTLLWLIEKGRIRLIILPIKHSLITIFLISGVVFFFVYKQFYILIKRGDWNEVANRALDMTTYTNSVTQSEPFITQAILNKVVETGYSINDSYILNNIFQFVPFSNNLGNNISGFNAYFQPDLFPDIPGGMAGNWWAEWLSIASWPGFLVGLLTYAITLTFLSLVLRRYITHRTVTAVVVVMGTLIAFYIHRNEITYFITLEKRVFGIWLIVTLLSTIMLKAAQQKPSNTTTR